MTSSVPFCRLLVLSLLLPLSALAAPAPFKGLVFWPDQARARPDLSREISLEFAYVLPSSVVTGLDPSGAPLFDWVPLDRLLDDIASRGHQAILRFRYEYPGEPLDGVPGATAVPACIKALPGYAETFAPDPNGDGPTHYADWSHPALADFTLRFFTAFAARYDADPRLAFLEVGFGHWSEWHTCGTSLQLGKNFPSLAFQTTFLKTLSTLFRQTPWLISIDAADTSRSPAASKALSSLSFGLFDDSFMHRRHDLSQGDGYNEKCWHAFGPDHWQRAPAGGEISYYEDSDQRRFLSPDGIHGTTFVAAAAKYHITFMIANDAPSGPFATPETFRSASDATGYSFHLDSWQIVGSTLHLQITNTGVAPLYHDAYPALGHSTSPTSLRGLLPTQSRIFTLPLPTPIPPLSTLPSRLRITSPKLPGNASIPFSIP